LQLPSDAWTELCGRKSPEQRHKLKNKEEKLKKEQIMATPPPEIDGLWHQLTSWSAYIVAALAGLLYKQGRDKAKEDKDAFTRELIAFRKSLEKCITQDDFSEHKKWELQVMQERKAAEVTLFNKLDKLTDKMYTLFNGNYHLHTREHNGD
jgi:hypothetical protein